MKKLIFGVVIGAGIVAALNIFNKCVMKRLQEDFAEELEGFLDL